MPEMIFADSAGLEQFGYDGESMDLHVIFTGGGHYVYSNVPAQVYEELLVAPSKGTFVNREVKGVYDYIKL